MSGGLVRKVGRLRPSPAVIERAGKSVPGWSAPTQHVLHDVAKFDSVETHRAELRLRGWRPRANVFVNAAVKPPVTSTRAVGNTTQEIVIGSPAAQTGT